MKRRTMPAVVAVAAACLTTTAGVAQADSRSTTAAQCPGATGDLRGYAVTESGALLCFITENVNGIALLSANPLASFPGGPRLLGVDFRVQDGVMWGLGTDNVLYKIDPTTGAAVAGPTLNVDVQPSGPNFAYDFNPTNGALRLIGEDDKNYAINVLTGVVTTNTALTPATVKVTGGAYTNNDLSAATGTTLFDLDVDGASDRLAIQSPPGDGVVAPTGSLGLAVGDASAFDIFTAASGPVNARNFGFAALNPGDTAGSSLYVVDLLRGKALYLGAFPSSCGKVVGLAIALAPN